MKRQGEGGGVGEIEVGGIEMVPEQELNPLDLLSSNAQALTTVRPGEEEEGMRDRVRERERAENTNRK